MIMASESPPPPPPPPAPPPPPPKVTDSLDKPERGGIMSDEVWCQEILPTHYLFVGQSGVYEYKQQCQRKLQKDTDSKNTVFLSHYRTVTPIIQSGPLCGLVAVAMVAPLVGTQRVTTEKLLGRAFTQGYTKQGEMFSASDMSSLVRSILAAPFRSEVVCNCDEAQILHYLLQGDFLLIPYDADKNHSPCKKKGHKAHWMLITGVFVAVNNAENIINLGQLEENQDYYEQDLYHLKPEKPTTPEILKILCQNTNRIQGVFVYGHQGKSKHTGVWTIGELLESNSQLTELGTERSADEYIVPEGGVEKGLCGQMVRIYRPQTVV